MPAIGLHGVSETDGEVFLQLPEGRGRLADGVVETWVDEEIGGDVAIKLECEGILPLQERILIGSIDIEARLPLKTYKQARLPTIIALPSPMNLLVITTSFLGPICFNKSFSTLEATDVELLKSGS